jgi:hypothetical protein
VDPATADLTQVMEGGGVDVAQDRAGTAGQDGRHPAPARGEALVADGVDAAMDAEQPPLVEAALDPSPRMPEVQQLRA